ncbi:hypothetical protein CFOL_v3_04815, partial [Cephalotus follicularis]
VANALSTIMEKSILANSTLKSTKEYFLVILPLVELIDVLTKELY